MDKLQITRVLSTQFGNKEEHKKMYALLDAGVSGYSQIPGAKYYFDTKKKYWSYIHVLVEGTQRLRIGYGFSKQKMRGSYQFNPSKLTKVGLKAIDDIVSKLLPGGLKALIETSRVNSVEIAIDFDDVLYADHLFIDPRLAKSIDTWIDLGTVYMGATTSKRWFRVYDKRRELLEKEKTDLGHDRLRIEANLNLPLCKLMELPDQPNPFATLMVLRRDAVLAAASNNPVIADFVQLMNTGELSAQQAYATTTKKKKPLREALAALQEPWWDPAKHWADAPKAIEWAKQYA